MSVSPDAVQQPVRDLSQQRVAGFVASLVVDHLEVVEVAEQHADPGVGLQQRAVETVGEQHPVRQPGQGVVQGMVLELVVHLGELGQESLVLDHRQELPGDHDDHEHDAQQQVDGRG